MDNSRIIDVKQSIFDENNKEAEKLRSYLEDPSEKSKGKRNLCIRKNRGRNRSMVRLDPGKSSGSKRIIKKTEKV